MTNRLEAQLAFLNEVDRLKGIQRSNVLQDLSRAENSAEHSWHLALFAMVFEPIAPTGVSIDRVIGMLLLHDLVEIDVGDHPIHLKTDWQSVAAAEAEAADRIFGLLPAEQGENLKALWQEFEAAETADAGFAKMLDYVQPVFQVLLATEPRPDHVAIARENLAYGRAAFIKEAYPDIFSHSESLLNGTSIDREDPLSRRLAFLSEADKLKSVLRATRILDMTRRENSGEHSWHIALYALTLSEHANREISLGRIVKMLLIHDLVEIDVGDSPIHGDHDISAMEAAEAAAADRIFGLLPENQAQAFRALWDEFEAAESNDAVFAKSIDRVQPVIGNLETEGGTWPEYNVTAQQLEDRVGWKVAKGAPAIWDHLQQRIADWFAANT
ncbi:putative hydrolase of HD superfamily [Shimia isoporae]|uniref:Putative hydrolase of HD superfamily n=1 Tax=Shimia isoporae TaxID=647720 RepID=A0A4R1NLY2_9RHOB|nr:HD domain-containing protein [Shimia isoporae]TCL09406.1 putative hydrolase of HD superfamily [Shimia isoporae]